MQRRFYDDALKRRITMIFKVFHCVKKLFFTAVKEPGQEARNRETEEKRVRMKKKKYITMKKLQKSGSWSWLQNAQF